MPHHVISVLGVSQGRFNLQCLQETQAMFSRRKTPRIIRINSFLAKISREILHALVVSTSRRKRFSHWLGAGARAYDGQ